MTTHASAVISIPCDMSEGYIFTTVVDGRQFPGMCDCVVVRSSSRGESYDNDCKPEARTTHIALARPYHYMQAYLSSLTLLSFQ
jgi:hypothetical protein